MTTDDMQALLADPRALGPNGIAVPAGPPLTFDHVTEDSRQVRQNSLFFAMTGTTHDGHDFAVDAKTKGAVAIAGERQQVQALEGLPYIFVANPRKALGLLAHRLAGDPSARMHVVGVTGTNGKSSTVALIAHILRAAGHRCATFGTLGYSIADTTREAAHTTPFGETLAALFKDAEDAECTHVVMEASSHAIAQERIAGIHFEGAVFTNLTQDHLDYHAGLDDYRDSKVRLFARLPENGFGVVNADDPAAPAFIDATAGRVYTYGREAAVRAKSLSMSAAGVRFNLDSPWGAAKIETPLTGLHNVANVLAAIGACGALGVPLDLIIEALRTVQPAPGRFELIDEGQPFYVVVDYAHTDDGLRNVLAAARELAEGHIICVFGCGGDRDKTKRPKMALAVAEGADFAVITSDNPRTENPERILLDIEVGMQRAGKSKRDDYEMILDRREAIRFGIEMARESDLVLIAGKGHEDYQILGTTKIHFDDREVAREVLAELRKTPK